MCGLNTGAVTWRTRRVGDGFRHQCRHGVVSSGAGGASGASGTDRRFSDRWEGVTEV